MLKQATHLTVRQAGWFSRSILALLLALVVSVGAGMQVHAGSAHGKKTGVTPLPSATPVKAAPGLILGMITRPISQVRQIQAAVDSHNKKDLFYLHPDLVVKNTLYNYGFKPPIQEVSPVRPFPRYAGRPVRKGIVKYQGQLYQVFVAQPLRQGPTGIWVIVTILRQKQITGGIAHSSAVIKRTQALADNDKLDGLVFLDPDSVVQKELPQYGYVPTTTTEVSKGRNCTTTVTSPGFKVISPTKPIRSSAGRPTRVSVIQYQGTKYDVYVAQLGRTGKSGIWVTVAIDPAY